MKTLLTTTALAGICFFAGANPASASDLSPNELLSLSLEQLSNIEVTSVSKRSEKASEAAAAIYVITQDDIRRSGMTTIPDLLRMVPGLNVAQSSSRQWAVSSRGSNDQFANKLLVLMDGRSVYTPLFSGVYWDVQDTVLEDIERIEVIRGPGATLWGANAVNGVINIITKSAKDTQGGMAAFSIGTQDRSLNRVRYGGKVADNAYVRAYAKYDDRDAVRTMSDNDAKDDWQKGQAGFRSDWSSSDRHSFTLQGDIYRGREDGQFQLPIPTVPFISPISDTEEVAGGNLIGRWNYKQSEISDVSLQVYYDATRRNSFDNFGLLDNTLQTFDVDVQHAWSGVQGHEIVWGGGYRLVDNQTKGDNYSRFTPKDRSDNLFSAFFQDKMAVKPDKFYITVGSKFEHNDYTGFEFQPSVRATWLVDSKQTLWASASNAIRTPNIASDDIQLIVAPFAANTLVARVGDRNTESEDLDAYELGYRIQPQKNLTFDVATFYNRYSDLTLGANVAPFVETTSIGTYAVIPVVPVNVGAATSQGVEVAANWQPTSSIDLISSYTYLNLDFKQSDPFGFSFEGKSPRHQFNLRSNVTMIKNVEITPAIYYVGKLDRLNVPSYTRADLRVAWKPLENLELSVVGQNLLESEHQEFTGFIYQANSQIPRSVYGNINWKF